MLHYLFVCFGLLIGSILLQSHTTRGFVSILSRYPSIRQDFNSKILWRVRMLSTTSRDAPNQNIRSENEKVVLLIGSLGLDRLLTVQTYPEADAKIRTISYTEVGGGNSANTASAMGKLATAGFMHGTNVRIRLLTKVGADSVGRQLMDELNASNVDTDSPLFLVGPPGSTTAFTTVIVSQDEQTRTCIHTPGTSGELTLQDAQSVDLDDLFKDVVHLHSDARHTDVALFLAKQAKRRGIPISCDVEKDRGTKALDELIQVCDVLFTNSNHLGAYLNRLSSEMEMTDRSRQPLPEPEVSLTKMAAAVLEHDSVTACIRSLQPSAYFTRWYSQSEKEVVVTQGSMGSLHYRPLDMSSTPSTDFPSNSIEIDVVQGDDDSNVPVVSLRHAFCDGTVRCETNYRILQSGVLQDLNIVDTTGAGDAFIGGYLISKIAIIDEAAPTQPVRAADSNIAQFGLELGSFVGGRKLEGPGARSALPTGGMVDLELGKDLMTVRSNLRKKIGHFNGMNDPSASILSTSKR